VLAVAAVLAGCSSAPVEPQIFTFNYALRQVPDVGALIHSITSGQRTIADVIGPDPCNFTASFAAQSGTGPPVRPVTNVNGNPGQMGFNISIAAATPVNINTDNPPGCPNIGEFNISIGERNEALDVRGRTNRGSAQLVVGGTHFTGTFLEATLAGFRQQTRYASGELRFVATTTVATTVLLVDGSYAFTPHR